MLYHTHKYFLFLNLEYFLSFSFCFHLCIFQFILKRNISKLQYIGAICIVLSIIVAKLDDVLTTSTNSIPSVAIVLAVVASCNSVAAALFTESLFKVIFSSIPTEWQHCYISDLWWELSCPAVLALSLWLPCLQHCSCPLQYKYWSSSGFHLTPTCVCWGHHLIGPCLGVQQYGGPGGGLHPQEAGQHCEGVHWGHC